MTKKLYLDDSYQKEFQAIVTRIDGKKVHLDQTHFFIQGAGQSGDSGQLSGIRVHETMTNGVHLLADEPTFQVGDSVTGSIDWDKRYRTMRLHSAAHITEYFIAQEFSSPKAEKTNVNHKRDFSDYKIAMPVEELQKEIETKCNEFIAMNTPVSIETDSTGFRKWSCGEIETGCTGTHVRSLSEIGKIRLEFQQKGPGTVRVITTLAS